MQSTIQPFVHKALDVNNTLLGIFNEKLELPLNTLGRFHTIEEPSGSEARVIKRGANNREDTLDEAAASIGAHTDFGSLVSIRSKSSILSDSSARSRSYTIDSAVYKFLFQAHSPGNTFDLSQDMRSVMSEMPWPSLAVASSGRIYTE